MFFFYFCVFNFLMFFIVFVPFLMSRFLFLLKVNIQNYKYDEFLMGKLRLVLFSIRIIITVT